MTTHLLKTPEYPAESFHAVCDLLKSFSGPIKYCHPDYPFRIKDFPYLEVHDMPVKYYSKIAKKNPENYKPDRYQEKKLTWDELLVLCNDYRRAKDIPKDDFVIVLTDRSNELNWFSYMDTNRNGFIQAEGWENFVTTDHKYPVAYQVMENILQSLMKLDASAAPNEFIHEKSRACINDFCGNKEDVILKLRTGDLCEACTRRVKEMNIPPEVIMQIISTIRGVRDQVLFMKESALFFETSPVVVTADYQVLLPKYGNHEIKLTPLMRTLYIFLLSKPNGVRLVDLCEFRNDLLTIYRKLDRRDDQEKSRQAIDSLVYANGESFNQKKSKINTAIRELLSDPRANNYIIQGSRNEAYKINLPSDMITFE
jgi:hypothetical protein